MTIDTRVCTRCHHTWRAHMVPRPVDGHTCPACGHHLSLVRDSHTTR